MLKKLNLALEEEQLLETVIESDPADSVELSINEEIAPIEDEAGELLELNEELTEATDEVGEVEAMADSIETQIEAGEDIDPVALENIRATIRIVSNRWGLPENKRLLNISHESYSQEDVNRLAMEGIREWVSNAFTRLGKLSSAIAARIAKFLNKINPFSANLSKSMGKVEALVAQADWTLTGSDNIGPNKKVARVFKPNGGAITIKSITAQVNESVKATKRAKDMMNQTLKIRELLETPISTMNDFSKLAEKVSKVAATVSKSKAFENKPSGSEAVPLAGNVMIVGADKENVFFGDVHLTGFKLEEVESDMSAEIAAGNQAEVLKLIGLGKEVLENISADLGQVFDEYSITIDEEVKPKPPKDEGDGEVGEEVLGKVKEAIKFASTINEVAVYFVMYVINSQLEAVRGIVNYATAVSKANGKSKPEAKEEADTESTEG